MIYTCSNFEYCSKIVAYHDLRSLPCSTIWHSDCILFFSMDDICCNKCNEYKYTRIVILVLSVLLTFNVLSSDVIYMLWFLDQKHWECEVSLNTPVVLTTTPEKVDNLRSLQRHSRCLSSKSTRLKSKVAAVIKDDSVLLDEQTSTDMHKIMEEESPLVFLCHKL